MKKIYLLLLLVITASTFTFTSCNSTEDPIITAGADDFPMILDPLFPDRNGDTPGLYSTITRDQNLKITVTVTPADYTKVEWFIDDSQVATGTELDMALLAGEYTLKVVATTTQGKSTYRLCTVKVLPLAGDATLQNIETERIVAPGISATLHGENLAGVKSFNIGGVEVTDFKVTADDMGEVIEYKVPEGLEAGVYRVVLNTADGSLGGGQITVSSAALVRGDSFRANAGAEFTLTGINLDDIAAITIGGAEVSNFTTQSFDVISFTFPALEVGDHTMTATSKSGQEVSFAGTTGLSNKATVTVTAETTVWEGHHYVSWELPDGNPNKTFNMISGEQFKSFVAGTTLRIYYSLESSAEYHQMQITSGWWADLPGTSKIDLAEDGVRVLVITQEMIDMVTSQDGFLCVGHGYYVDRVTIQ